VASRVLEGIDPAVRDTLKVNYSEVEVRDLFQLQIGFINDGDRAIKDCIEPLSLVLPSNVKLLDVALLNVQPKERAITTDSEQINSGTASYTKVNFNFRLLNKGDHFLVKFLLDGTPDVTQLEFRITADDLPPTIRAKDLPSPFLSDRPRTMSFGGRVAATMFCWYICVVSVFSALIVYRARSEIRFILPLAENSSLIVAYAVTLICGVMAFLMFFVGSIALVDLLLMRISRHRLPFFKYPGAEQIVGRERRKHVSHHDSSGDA
jgi:hypothetical protein